MHQLTSGKDILISWVAIATGMVDVTTATRTEAVVTVTTRPKLSADPLGTSLHCQHADSDSLYVHGSHETRADKLGDHRREC